MEQAMSPQQVAESQQAQMIKKLKKQNNLDHVEETPASKY